MWRGLAYVLCAALSWGLSATAAQALFRSHGVTADWLTAVRMVGAGTILAVALRPRLPLGDLPRLLAFGILGFVSVQYTYLFAIQATNAALATFLQYLGVPLIAVWELAASRRRPGAVTLLAVVAAVAGTALLAFGGAAARGAGHVTPGGLVAGLVAGLALAFYTLFSADLVARHGAAVTTTWGMLLGGVVLAAAVRPWRAAPAGDALAAWGLVAFVVLVGTLLAFGLYVASLAHIRPTEAGVAATFEPVAAALASYVFLGVALAPLQYVGGAFILAAVALLRLGSSGARATEKDAVQPPAPGGRRRSSGGDRPTHSAAQ
ncbi:MAG: EamA family transporter [Clostridia bacterium]|nr:EamA family transporter [Clostridia bacterium]